MPTSGEAERWRREHPAPPRPPNVGSEERERWKDEIGEDEAVRQMKAWQDWWNKENTFQENALKEAYGHQDWESTLKGLGYEDVREKGASVYAKFRERNAEAEKLGYKDWQDMSGKQAWGKVRDTHYTFDSPSGLYVNSGTAGANDYDAWDWRSATGERVGSPRKSQNMSAFASSLTSPRVSAASYDFAYPGAAGSFRAAPGNATVSDKGSRGAYGVTGGGMNATRRSSPVGAGQTGSYATSPMNLLPTANTDRAKEVRGPWAWI